MMRTLRGLIGMTALACLAGCVPPPPATPSQLQGNQPPTTTASSDHPDHPGHEDHAAPPTGDPIADAAAGAPSVSLPADTPAPASDVSAADVTKLESELAANPDDEALKVRVAGANFTLGHAYMSDPALMPMMKYPNALKYLRRTLALTPQHIQARQDIAMIEGIYADMGRPVPQ